MSLVERAESIGLLPLVEVHDADEVVRAVDAGAKVIGVNARDLRTLEVDLGIFAQVAPTIPEGVLRVAESGVRSPQDLLAYAASGADAVLVGEALVTHADPGAAVHDLVSAGSIQRSATPTRRYEVDLPDASGHFGRYGGRFVPRRWSPPSMNSMTRSARPGWTTPSMPNSTPCCTSTAADRLH